MAKYQIEYEVIGHHYKTIEIPDDMYIKTLTEEALTEEVDIQALNDSPIGDDHPCEEYHGDLIEECIITNISKVEEGA